jgi:hypothetical protein
LVASEPSPGSIGLAPVPIWSPIAATMPHALSSPIRL